MTKYKQVLLKLNEDDLKKWKECVKLVGVGHIHAVNIETVRAMMDVFIAQMNFENKVNK